MSVWRKEALSKLKAHPQPVSAYPADGYTLGREKAAVSIAQAVSVSTAESQSAVGMRVSTVHGVKGQEADAVLLAVAPKSVPVFLSL